MLPNRIAVYVTALGALAAGLAPVVANLDWQSTAGVIAAIIAITGVVSVWLYNWGKWERMERDPEPFVAAANAPQGTTLRKP